MAYRWTENLTGEGEAQERGIVGETPNLAARVQALAEPSSVVIGASTHRLLGNRFALRSLGLHDLKGFADLVEAWVVEGVSVAQPFRVGAARWVHCLRRSRARTSKNSCGAGTRPQRAIATPHAFC
jgi:Adenylate and Guanylate cyclase catalytic domain